MDMDFKELFNGIKLMIIVGSGEREEWLSINRDHIKTPLFELLSILKCCESWKKFM